MTAGPETCIPPAAMAARGNPGIPGAILMLTKPRIVLAEGFAGLAGMLLACQPQPPSPATAFWGLTVLAMASSGAAMVNCIIDAAADRQMQRLTERSRALSTAGRRPVLYIALVLMAGAGTLTFLLLNSCTLLLLAAACSSYLLLYSCWLKRRSPWGVVAGAVPGALPPLIGAAAVSGRLSLLPLLLTVIIFIWQLPHFWFLALHHHTQYRQAGIPVLPVSHGILATKRLILCTAALLLPATVALSTSGRFSSPASMIAMLDAVIFLLCCYRYLFRTEEYRKGFIVSLVYLALLFAALITDSIINMRQG